MSTSGGRIALAAGPHRIGTIPSGWASTATGRRSFAAYRDHLEHSPGLKLRLPELRGKVLGWCHPEPCHGDLLCEAVN